MRWFTALFLLLSGSLIPVKGLDEVYLYLKGRWRITGFDHGQHHVVRFSVTKNSISGAYTDQRGIQKKVSRIGFDGRHLVFQVPDFGYRLELKRLETHFEGTFYDDRSDSTAAVSMTSRQPRRGKLVTRTIDPAAQAEPRSKPTQTHQKQVPSHEPDSAGRRQETVYLTEDTFILKGDWLLQTSEGKRRRWYLSFSGGSGNARGSWITPQGFERNLTGVAFDGQRLRFTIEDQKLVADLTRDEQTFSGRATLPKGTHNVSLKRR